MKKIIFFCDGLFLEKEKYAVSKTKKHNLVKKQIGKVKTL